MNADNKVKVVAVLLLVAACGLMIPVTGDNETTDDRQELTADSIVDANQQNNKTDDYIFQVAISFAALIVSIAGMLYIVNRMKNQTN